MLEVAAVKPPVSGALIFDCHKRFRNGQDSIEDDKGRGRKQHWMRRQLGRISRRRYTVRDIFTLQKKVEELLILC